MVGVGSSKKGLSREAYAQRVLLLRVHTFGLVAGSASLAWAVKLRAALD
jgi:hypothetical protein